MREPRGRSIRDLSRDRMTPGEAMYHGSSEVEFGATSFSEIRNRFG